MQVNLVLKSTLTHLTKTSRNECAGEAREGSINAGRVQFDFDAKLISNIDVWPTVGWRSCQATECRFRLQLDEAHAAVGCRSCQAKRGVDPVKLQWAVDLARLELDQDPVRVH